MFIFICFLLVFVLYLFNNFYWKRRNYPPGPCPLPVLGNLIPILLSESPEDAFIEWKKEYGNIYTYWLGEDPIVAFNDYDSIQEYFKKNGDVFAGRQQIHDFHSLTRGGTLGIIDTDGDLWREQRHFALHVLRTFGLGKNLMQERILEEVSYLIEKFKVKALTENELGIADDIGVAIGSIINFILFGYRFSQERLFEFHQLRLLMANLFEEMGNPLIFPTIANPKFFKNLPFFGAALERLQLQHHNIFQFFSRQIEEHKKLLELDKSHEPTDFVEAYLQEARKHDESDNWFSHQQLTNVCYDLWIAGQETTSTTLAWGVAFMIRNLDVQKNIHVELDEIIGGTNRIVTISDRSLLPYTNAVIAEIQRLANLIPHNLLHRTTEDVQVGEYLLPKNCLTVPQISVVLYDDKVFENPKQFNPSRFIDERGSFKTINELIPFSVGKRQCLGESLAKMELFLFISNLFNQFQFLPGDELPQITRTFGGTAQCPPFKCRIIKRL